MKKILIISNLYFPYVGGGAEHSTKILAEELVKENFNVEVLTVGKNNVTESINGVNVNRINIGFMTKYVLNMAMDCDIKLKAYEKIIYRLFNYINVPLYRRFLLFLNSKSYDIIHTTNNMTGFSLYLCWKAAKKSGFRVVHSVRDPSLLSFKVDLDKKIFLLDMIHRKIARYYLEKYVDVIHSPSEYMIKLHKKFDFKIERYKVIPNTVQVPINIETNKKDIVLYAGNLSQKKGVLDLVHAFLRLNNPSYMLLLIGDGELKEYITKTYANKNIRLLGWLSIDEVYKYMRESKAVVLPSRWDEAFGRILVESVFCGTLPVGSDKGAIPEVLNYETRYIFETESDLTQKLARIFLMNDKEYNDEVSRIEKNMEKFIVKNHIKEFSKFYENI